MGIPERFESKYVPEPLSGCWLWTAALNACGYGWMQVGSRTGSPPRRAELAHRMSWRIFVGEIPDGMSVLHRCDTPPCVNPEHLFLGTQKDNMADCASKGRIVSMNANKSHCPRGHEYMPENTRIDGGSRKCRTCLIARDRARGWRR